MIEAGVASFLEGRVMVLIATRNAAHRPMIGRATGARFDADSGRITLLVSSSQWPDAVAHALPGTPISATFVQPDTYEAYQIKGPIIDLRPANASSRPAARAMSRTCWQPWVPLGSPACNSPAR